MSRSLFKRVVCLALCAGMTLGSIALFASCANSEEGSTDTKASAGANESVQTEEEDLRFVDVDFNRRTFTIHTSTNAASTGMGNSNFLIQGGEELVGEGVSDAVLERNKAVEDLLNIELTYEQCDLNYDLVKAEITRLTMSGVHEFDLVINDLFSFAPMSIEGYLTNVIDDNAVFDFSRDYWYEEYMEDLRMMDGYQFMLAGDYFADILRSAHCLLYNKTIFTNYCLKTFGDDPDVVYDWVLNHDWTYERMNEMITDVYADANGNSQRDKGDLYGMLACEFWGCSIPFTVSGNPPFIARDEDGVPTEIIMLQGERSSNLATAMTKVFRNDCSSIDQTGEPELLQAFTEGQALICTYQRLGSLENTSLRSMEGDIGVIPYPLLYKEDEYVTSCHDTTEVGAILRTANPDDMKFISTVIEVLNRESARTVVPKYYKEALQIKYVDDSKAAEMIDIIHDNFGNAFLLAFNVAYGNVTLQAFTEAVQSQREFSVEFKEIQNTLLSKIREQNNLFARNNLKN